MEDSQHISVLSSAVLKVVFTEKMTMNDVFKCVKYEDITSVLRQSDKPTGIKMETLVPLYSNYATTYG